MSLPLYRDHGAPSRLRADGHMGLWWDKFFHFYNASWQIEDGDKSEWIRRVSDRRSSPENRQVIERFVIRQMELGQCLGAKQKVFETQWHFVTGLGIPHPVENGFSWHPTLGVPYLTGSAVKGLLRAWVEEWLFEDGQEEEKKERIHRWFGRDENDEKSEKAKAGDLIFFDAIPVQPVETEPPMEMGPDITNPHMGKWLEQGASITDVSEEPEKVPADYHSPIPIVFLVVKQAKFLFQIAPRGNTNPDEVVEAMKELQAALEWLGAGAKTAVGYGRMRDNVEQFEALQQKLPHQITETEFVTMTAAPSGTTVQVATEKEELVRCTGLPHIEAKANWGTGATLFLAQVTRRDGIAVKAVWDGW